MKGKEMAEEKSEECYSCGQPADPDSPRNFCGTCDMYFGLGQLRQTEIEERHDKLVAAREAAEAGDDAAKAEVKEIMYEIFEDSASHGPSDPDAPAKMAKMIAAKKKGK